MSTLTDAEVVNIRRWMGYPLASAAGVETVYTPGPPRIMFADRLDALTSIEEDTLRDQFLTPLAALETGVLGTADNMDTKIAGPWTANPDELGERNRLYTQWRREMCAFLGFAPGPSLGSGGGAFLVRS
jgi:hypothetical protein